MGKPVSKSAEGKTEIYFYSGKGGVGKTSSAAATALWLSEHGKKTLIISIDPAHSLSDSFEEKIGGETKKLGKNLWGLELDPSKAMCEYKEKFMSSFGGSGFLKSAGLEDTFDIAGMTPGMDEIAAFDKFLKYMNSDEYDAIVFDTAPTGHALRFLSLPDVLDSWVGKLIKLKAQFSGITSLVKKILPFGSDGDCAEAAASDHLEDMKKRIASAREILADRGRTHFNLVLIPEEMSIFESLRSLETLSGFGITVESVVVNNIVPENSGCGFCKARRARQLERVKEIRKKFKGCEVKELPLFPDEVKGRKMLEKVGKLLNG